MKLTEEQQAAVRAWAESGATLNDIQNRLRDEFSIRMTFMDVRFLVLDLNITLHTDPVEVEPEPTPVPEEEDLADLSGPVVSADEITLPGAMVSGKVTFSDGVLAMWYIDAQGRLGLQGPDPAYQPPADDIPLFQQRLQEELHRRGMY